MGNLNLTYAIGAGHARSHVRQNFNDLTAWANGNIDQANLANDGITAAKLVAAVREALVPAGSLLATARAAAPSGYLLCDGAAVSRATYADLFDAIGTAYGAGDGSTTFNLPDLRGRVPAGLGTHSDVNVLVDNDGLAVASRTPRHTHGVSGNTGVPHAQQDTQNISGVGYQVPATGHIHVLNTTSAPSWPAYQVVNWIVKT